MHSFARFILIAAASAVLLCSAALPAAAVSFSYTEISKAGWDGLNVNDMNEGGQIVGSFIGMVSIEGFLYDDGSYTSFLPPGWTYAGANGISDSGDIVGFGFTGTANLGWLYSGGVYTELLPPGWTYSNAHAVNNMGQIIGSGGDGFDSWGYLYDGAAYTTLAPPGFTGVTSRDLNESGHVVGNGWDGVSSKGWLYDGASYSPIMPPGWAYASTAAINNVGQIVGYGSPDAVTMGPAAERTPGPAATKAFLYDGSSYTTLLPPGWQSAMAGDINDQGHIIGEGLRGDGIFTSFIYIDGVYYEIEPLPSTPPVGAVALNELDQIAARGGSGMPRASARTSLSPRSQAAGFELGPSMSKGFLIELEPSVDLKANGSDGPVVIRIGDTLKITAVVSTVTDIGIPGDWFLYALTPTGVMSFDPRLRAWSPGFARTGRFPLRNLGTVPVFRSRDLMQGPYSFHLLFDRKPNGRIGPGDLLSDAVTVIVQ